MDPERLTRTALLGGALLAALGAGAGAAAELRVRPFDRLDTTLAAAADGDTVRVEGRHFGRFVLARRIELRGEPGAVLDGGGQGTVLTLCAAGSAVHDLELRGSGPDLDAQDAALCVQDAPGAKVERVRVRDSLFGIVVVGSPGTWLRDSSIEGKDLPPARRGDGIRLWKSDGCSITGNRVRRTRDMVIWYSSETRVEENEVTGARYGLHFMFSDRNSAHRNRFQDDQVGAMVMDSRGVELAGNLFAGARGPSACGLLVEDSDDVFVTGNRFLDDTTAILLDRAPRSRDGRLELRGNRIAGNDVGLALRTCARGARIWENTFTGNRTQVLLPASGGPEDTAWAVDGRGNHWSDAVPYDRDGDGVSEIPYRIGTGFERLADGHPALALFEATPAADALDAAARLFPVLAPGPGPVDPHPLVVAPGPAAPGSEPPPPPPPGAGAGLAGAGVLMLAGAALAARWTAGSPA